MPFETIAAPCRGGGKAPQAYQALRHAAAIHVTLQRERRGAVELLTLNRPEAGNALNPELFRALKSALDELAHDMELRVLVIRGAGHHFCAGADLNWMRAGTSSAETHELAALFRALAEFPVPTIAQVQGACLGGAMGLVAACDYVFASDRARFGFTEVRLGLAPAVISPYVISRLGTTQTRELFLTGERFDAQRAQALGLVRSVVPAGGLELTTDALVKQLLEAAPRAQRAIKRLLRDPPDADGLVTLIDDLRAGEEGQEGLCSFFDKREPAWRQ